MAEFVGVDGNDDWSFFLFADFEDAVHHRVVTDIEGRDREVVLVRHIEDGLAVYQHLFYLMRFVDGMGFDLLHGAGGHTAHEVALEEDIKNENRYAAQDAYGHHLVPLVGMLTHEELDADGDGSHILGFGQCQCEEIFIPRDHEG